MGDDVVVAFADAVESQSPRRNCQTLSTGFNSGNRSGCGRRLVLAGTSRLPEVPSSLVENEDGVSVGRDHCADLEEMRLHVRCVRRGMVAGQKDSGNGGAKVGHGSGGITLLRAAE